MNFEVDVDSLKRIIADRFGSIHSMCRKKNVCENTIYLAIQKKQFSYWQIAFMMDALEIPPSMCGAIFFKRVK